MLQDQPLDIRTLRAAYGAGLDPTRVIDEVYRRIEAVEDPGIFLHVLDRDAVLADAAALGPFDPVTKPLWGVPFAIKDNIDAAGTPTTAACPAFAYIAERDAFVVGVLRRAGAILIGKTNLDQFATGLVGVRSPYPPPRNALDPTIVPGGSSSGSAVAVAQGIVGFALGTDTAGSGRVPAALNGIVGLKPTLGALSASGVVPACRTLDTVSVFALTVDDAYTVFRAAGTFDPSDPYARPVAAPPLAPPPAAFRVAVPNADTREFFGDGMQAASFTAAVDEIAGLGGEVVDIDFGPFFKIAAMLYDGPWVVERYAVLEALLRDRPDAFHPITRRVVETAHKVSAADVFRGFYRLQELKRLAMPLVERVDLLCVPSIPTFCTLADVDTDPVGANTRLGTYTNFVNLMDLCGITVPVAPRADGRPGSVTLLARSGRDAHVAAVADALQRRSKAPLGATGWRLPAPPRLPSEPYSDEIALAVVGAHMSGLPLNGELTRLGARFLREAKTAPVYRLYSLPGGPPVRPGLVRDETGSTIALEVWALPASNFGRFIRNIPSPLCIGTLTLEDEEEVKGFLCEKSATAGAEDISRHGGWRAFLQHHPSPRHRTKETDHAET